MGIYVLDQYGLIFVQSWQILVENDLLVETDLMMKRAKQYLLKCKICHFVPLCATRAMMGVLSLKQVQKVEFGHDCDPQLLSENWYIEKIMVIKLKQNHTKVHFLCNNYINYKKVIFYIIFALCLPWLSSLKLYMKF